MKRIAIITGASSGLGWEFALQLDKQGDIDEIWLVARRRDKLEELGALFNYSEAVIVVADLSHAAGCMLLANRLKSEPRELVMFVNNAGFGSYGPFLETDRERQLSMIDLNIRALTDLSWIALSHMDRGGILINVASLAAFMPLGNFAVYAATKAYVLSLSIALAAENKHRGVKVQALCPGSTSTEFSKVASGGAQAEVEHGQPASKVVATCLRQAREGRWLSLYAFDWKLTAFMSRFFSRKLIARLTYRFAKRPHAPRE